MHCLMQVFIFLNSSEHLKFRYGGAAPPTNGKDPKEVLANEASGTAYWQMNSNIGCLEGGFADSKALTNKCASSQIFSFRD
ncbi:unnamed protein product [Rhizophagus irregularis]|uniref:Uncharacterized protein n=1 Tax=Rhizophagus irregularis TaxID=588596 RepID=A0A916E5W1_9GLOM|nr:unnamed protein product [Rhizophagus irregularis]CAB5357304.1 unnamed protein product [Rhizophagus irregularis]